MRKSIVLIAFSVAMFPGLALAEKQINVLVKGMVCSFCAQGIKKKFSAEEAINKVDVSLEKHQVLLSVKDGQDLGDKKISELLNNAGYTVEKISRENPEATAAKQ